MGSSNDSSLTIKKPLLLLFYAYSVFQTVLGIVKFLHALRRLPAEMLPFLGKVDFLVIMLGRYYSIVYLALLVGLLAAGVIAFLPLNAWLLSIKVLTEERVGRTFSRAMFLVLGVATLAAALGGLAYYGFKTASILYGEWGNTIPFSVANGDGTFSQPEGFTLSDRFLSYPAAVVPLFCIIKYSRRFMNWFDATKRLAEQLTAKWLV